ncbi:bilirubin oxidase [Microthyrium microscopicum]|uniref:Bilirubin oxidase n=1 Tax=Microthyrium microscopicum TaxID=703497 RepID=A0A6A6UM14_9PEZI|nr:bilirubin oxidase [Microthyrium microscopicum]
MFSYRCLITSLSILNSLPLVLSAGWASPEYPAELLFNRPLPIPPVKTPLYTFTNNETGARLDYYEVQITPFTKTQYPNLGPAQFIGYDGMFPGPTFKACQGRESIVRFINVASTLTSSVHLHGSYTRAPFDGYADDKIRIGEYKDYYYPNKQSARTLHYHDHVADHTAKNVYYGQTGMYIIEDPEEQALGLPKGNYDIPLAIMARQYTSNGSLYDPEANGEIRNLYGDVNEVNGQPWPYLQVEPRKYRFRILDLGISRTYLLYLTADQQQSQRINMTIVGSDAGLLAYPVSTQDLGISVGERWEVIVDFAPFKGQNVTMMNVQGIDPSSDYNSTDKVMRFVVGNTVKNDENNGPIPQKLREVPFPPNNSVDDREFLFALEGGEWKINGVTWSDIRERLLASPKRGSIESWTFRNGDRDASHPIHTHLIDFQVISRTSSFRGVLPYEAAALKDVVWLAPGETVRMLARFSPWPGVYMFHCHNLIHEDHQMLVEFNVTQVEGLDLNETELFIDPLDPQYRPVGYSASDLSARIGSFSREAIRGKVSFLLTKHAYGDVNKVDEALDAYWHTKAQGEEAGSSEPSALQRRNLLNGWTNRIKQV